MKRLMTVLTVLLVFSIQHLPRQAAVKGGNDGNGQGGGMMGGGWVGNELRMAFNDHYRNSSYCWYRSI